MNKIYIDFETRSLADLKVVGGAKYAANFWSKVDKSGDCWEWTARLHPGGYGIFSMPRALKLKNRTQRAHRVAYELTYGAIPKSLFVCHHCDNRKCVNPIHLYVGNQAQNMKDASLRNRIEKGEQRKQAKLTEEKVIQLRKDRQTMSLIELANKYSVSVPTASLIARGLKWKHV